MNFFKKTYKRIILFCAKRKARKKLPLVIVISAAVTILTLSPLIWHRMK